MAMVNHRVSISPGVLQVGRLQKFYSVKLKVIRCPCLKLGTSRFSSQNWLPNYYLAVKKSQWKFLLLFRISTDSFLSVFRNIELNN